MKKTFVTMLAIVAFLLATTAARADELDCVAGREKAAGRYAYCQSKAKVRYVTDGAAAQVSFAKCRIKYVRTWEKLKAKNPGTTCDTTTRFVDNGDSTVTDHLTGLVWELKGGAGGGSNFAYHHDVDNTYTLTNGDADQTDGDGTAFTDFLAELNSGGFAGANDWRLPTVTELQTILLPAAFPCPTSPCIDPAFGSDAAAYYWSASTRMNGAEHAWAVSTGGGFPVGSGPKTLGLSVRAVRSGL